MLDLDPTLRSLSSDIDGLLPKLENEDDDQLLGLEADMDQVKEDVLVSGKLEAMERRLHYIENKVSAVSV